MADYFSLLAKLLDGLPDAAPTVRTGVYDRARRALRDQLKTVQPPLSEEEIEREAAGLEEAIRKLETRYEGSAAAPASERASAQEPSMPPAAPTLPAATPPTKPLPSPSAPPPAAPAQEPAPKARRPLTGGAKSPAAIRAGGRRPTSQWLLIALVVLAVPVGIVGWLWRGDRAPSSPPATQVAAAPPGPVDQKYDERVAGGSSSTVSRPAAPGPSQDSTASRPAPAAPSAPSAPPPAAQNDRVPATPAPPTAAPAPQPSAGAAPAQPSPSVTAPATAPAPANNLAVAQRAMIFEENQVDPQQPIMSAGRAIWQLDTASGGQGMPLETVIRGRVDLPGAGLSLSIVVRRNLDAALPASHTIELSFAAAAINGNPPRVVRDVALPVMRPDETIRGVPVAGLPVPVKENVFLIGLSDLKADIERNTELLLRRNWMELPIRFASGQKAALLFDKGVSGERVFQDAFRQWGQTP